MNRELLILFLEISASLGMQRLDMCAIFSKRLDDNSVKLFTPGYTEKIEYPNNSLCQCDVRTLQPSSQFKSLNVTVLDLKLEICSETATSYDLLTIRTANDFEDLYREFKLCGRRLPLTRSVSLADEQGRRYGSVNTIYSLETLRVTFNTDDTVEDLGAELLVESHRGLSVDCFGVSGVLTSSSSTTPPTTPPPTRSTTRGFVEDRWSREENERKKSTITTAAIIGTIVALFAVAAAIVVFILIRRKRGLSYPKLPSSADRRPSTGRMIYRDPCLGMPALPMPGSVRVDCTDQYLYMKDGLTTPIYENPDLMGGNATEGDTGIYMNEELNGNTKKSGEGDAYGYIIPGEASTSGTRRESSPLIRGLVLTKNKPPIPEPKKNKTTALLPSKPVDHPKLNHTCSDDSASSERPLISAHNSPVLNQRTATESNDNTNELVYEPALVKPSDMRNKAISVNLPSKPPAGPIGPKPVVKVSNNAPPPPPKKPEVKAKPNLKHTRQGLPPPPTPPKKPGNAKPGDSFEVVNIETTT